MYEYILENVRGFFVVGAVLIVIALLVELVSRILAKKPEEKEDVDQKSEEGREIVRSWPKSPGRKSADERDEVGDIISAEDPELDGVFAHTDHTVFQEVVVVDPPQVSVAKISHFNRDGIPVTSTVRVDERMTAGLYLSWRPSPPPYPADQGEWKPDVKATHFEILFSSEMNGVYRRTGVTTPGYRIYFANSTVRKTYVQIAALDDAGSILWLDGPTVL